MNCLFCKKHIKNYRKECGIYNCCQSCDILAHEYIKEQNLHCYFCDKHLLSTDYDDYCDKCEVSLCNDCLIYYYDKKYCCNCYNDLNNSDNNVLQIESDNIICKIESDKLDDIVLQIESNSNITSQIESDNESYDVNLYINSDDENSSI